MTIIKRIELFINGIGFIKVYRSKKNKEILEVYYEKCFDQHPRKYIYFFCDYNSWQNGIIYTCNFKVFKQRVAEEIGYSLSNIKFIEEK